ncbi:acetyl-CoA hydrolase/transferase C-terminal domain-containing protein [Jiella marina]|uniref:acetyl-CoA hydrolase/transferase C-terminal domain-containing protein n=1 Tax=Jiella sp. LLJ827 TaxID=2917712 RepID=UPI002100B528|nr:acetyl-CoA hydrolase/transferase C-terminal domain-containing protein [Jiella sp. LLJ827]MCQ0987828.1 acetyl-CoA hydrolase [Jiella sp. LLJ827]
MTRRFEDADAVAQAIVERVGHKIVLALPLGLGKGNHVANALFRLAKANTDIDLKIFTALSLDPPSGGDNLAGRFAGPLAERLYDGVTRLDYVEARKRNALPPNVRVVEFFLQAGALIGNRTAQMDYISANYTHAARYLLESGVNVIAQMVSPSSDRSEFSLASNTDMTLDLLSEIAARRQTAEPALLVGEANVNLPFMTGAAALPADHFDMILEGESVEHSRLFSIPKQPISTTEHAIGLHCAGLVKDGGTIQIGIGGLGNAIANALILRHRDPETFRACLGALGNWPGTIAPQTGSFEEGLYGLSEMFVDPLLQLFEAGILKRPASDGKILHGGFFIGPESFYERLREMDEAERDRLSMREISFINDLPKADALRHAADRRDARFFNSAMIATALGTICSDQLDSGQVVSGVGGQYNFVAQAFELDGARSVLSLPATRNGGAQSNIRWSYGHTTVPRHLKDLVVTEYGIADLRGRTDRDTVAAMIGIADRSAQGGLIDKAVAAGKLEKGFAPQGDNRPERLKQALAPFAERLPAYPFGTDLTEEEQILAPALGKLKTVRNDRLALAKLAAKGLFATPTDREERALRRMRLMEPKSLKERGLRAILLQALRATG